MDPNTWKKIKDAYVSASEMNAEARVKFLDEQPTEIRDRVAKLLNANDLAGEFIENPFLVDQVKLDSPDAVPGEVIDDYRIVSKLGTGGMGTVYLAEHVGEGFSQRVALKLIKSGMDTHVVLRRFLVERQILAGLEHRNIARMLDGGSTPDGRPYFVMEYVDGSPIRSYCDDRRMDTRSRVAIFAKVCETVSYAHQKLVVHRDLKPSNIIVDGKGEPKLLDFGIAKLMAPDWQANAETVTATQFRILTPEYSSPEQLRGEPTTTSTDVYSLGVVLYELLTGIRPFQNESRNPAALAEAIRTKEPPKPSVAALFDSTKLSADAKATSPDAANQTGNTSATSTTRKSVPDPQALRGDIDNIVMKAIRRDPDSRYASVQEMIEDLERYLNGLPVKATGDTFSYRARKFIRRHSAGAIVATIVTILLIATASIAVWQAVRAERERSAAESRAKDVRALANALIFDVHDSIRELPGSTSARKMIVARALEYIDKLAAEGRQDMTLQQELAAGYERIGDVQGNPLGPNLGETAPAAESYTRALELREALFDNSDTPGRYATAMLHSKLFRIMQFGGNLSDAQSHCESAIRILDGVSAADPTNSLYIATIARFHQELGDLIWTRSQDGAEQAFDHYQKAISLIGTVPDTETNRVTGADGLNLNEKLLSVRQMAYKRIGERYEAEGRTAEALEAFRKAVEECEKLVAAGEPRKQQAEVVLAIALGNSGRLEARNGDPEAGLAMVRRAIDLFDSAVKSDPKNYLAKTEVALIYWSEGSIRLGLDEMTSSLASFKRAEELQRGLLKINPNDLYNLGNLAETLASTGTAYEKMGDVPRAADSYRKSLEIWTGMRDKGLLPGYHAHQLSRLEASLERLAV